MKREPRHTTDPIPATVGTGRRKALKALGCCAMLWLSACTGTPIEQCVPDSREAGEILALLVRYRQARADFDLQGYLGCLHAGGVFHHASRIMLSKAELAARLPDFWRGLRQGNRLFFPMCRENLSGNYFVDFRLFDPVIEIGPDAAKVTVTYVNGGWRLRHYISLVREDGRWWIDRLDWDTG